MKSPVPGAFGGDVFTGSENTERDDGLAAGVGRIVTDSSFHHYVDVIGDPCGSTPDRRRGFGTPYRPPAPGSVLADLGTCYVNTVRWFAGSG
ncbi:hypothetical protein [Nocardia xishanensis]